MDELAAVRMNCRWRTHKTFFIESSDEAFVCKQATHFLADSHRSFGTLEKSN